MFGKGLEERHQGVLIGWLPAADIPNPIDYHPGTGFGEYSHGGSPERASCRCDYSDGTPRTAVGHPRSTVERIDRCSTSHTRCFTGRNSVKQYFD